MSDILEVEKLEKPDTVKNRRVVTNTMGRKKKHKKLGVALVIFVVAALIVGILGIFTYSQTKEVIAKGREAAQTARELQMAIKNQDLENTSVKLEEMSQRLENVQESYNKMKWLQLIPFVRSYYSDGIAGLNAGKEFLQAGKIAVNEIKPYADLLGLTVGESSFVNKPADERIKTAITTFSKVTPKLSEIAIHLDNAKQEIDKIDSKRYPEKFQGKEIRSRIQSGKEMGDDLITFFVQAQPLLSKLPDILGSNGTRTYLLLFQNDKELRSTGGFITAYALLRFENGKMTVIKSDDIYKLDERLTKKIEAPPEIKKYHKGVFYSYLRDSNTSPDFSESMKKFENLYQYVSGADKYDGIIALDTELLVRAIQVLDGEIYVPEYNTKFTTKEDSRCDGCPQVIYELEEYADKPVGYARGERKDILGKLMLSLMQKSLGVSPSIYWGKLSQTLLELLNEKHIMFYMKDQDEQEAVKAVNFAGTINDTEGDYLHINDTNFAGAKSNMFVKHTVTSDISSDKDGKAIRTITIEYKNPSQPSNCNLEKGDLCLNGLLRNWLRVYVPKGSKLISFEGSEKEPVTTEDLGKTVFEGYNEVAPLGSSKVTIQYELPFGVDKIYKLLIQKQPGTFGHQYIIQNDGKEIDKFLLTTDKQLEYSL